MPWPMILVGCTTAGSVIVTVTVTVTVTGHLPTAFNPAFHEQSLKSDKETGIHQRMARLRLQDSGPSRKVAPSCLGNLTMAKIESFVIDGAWTSELPAGVLC